MASPAGTHLHGGCQPHPHPCSSFPHPSALFASALSASPTCASSRPGCTVPVHTAASCCMLPIRVASRTRSCGGVLASLPCLGSVALHSHGGALACSASAAAGGPSPSSPKGRWRELNEFAWVYGGPACVHTGFSAHSQSTSTLDTWAPAAGPQGTSTATCTSSDGSTPNRLLEPLDDGADAPEAPPSEPPLSLAGLIQETFRGAHENCRAQLARLGKDPDSEVVHDLRVVLRRLRNMLRLFYPYLVLPKHLEPGEVSLLLRALGAVRDSGAMMETLEKVEKRFIPSSHSASAGGAKALDDAAETSVEAVPVNLAEGKSRAGGVLEDVRRHLRALEQKQLAAAHKELVSRHGRKLFSALEAWGQDPVLGLKCSATSSGKKSKKSRRLRRHEAAFLASPMPTLAPSMLTPHVSSLLLHPAWAIEDIWLESSAGHEGAEVDARASAILGAGGSGSASPAVIHNGGGKSLHARDEPLTEPDVHLCEATHDLRKHLRELRYAMELLAPVYMVDERRTAPASVVEPSLKSQEGSSHALRKHFRESLAQVKELQGVLGDLQDLQVLGAFLKGYQKQQQQQQRRHSSKGLKGCKGGVKVVEAFSAVAQADAAGMKEDEVHVSLDKVQDEILRLQQEVWSKWLDARKKMRNDKGRYKLSKALILRSQPQPQFETPVEIRAEDLTGQEGQVQVSPVEQAYDHGIRGGTTLVQGKSNDGLVPLAGSRGVSIPGGAQASQAANSLEVSLKKGAELRLDGGHDDDDGNVGDEAEEPLGMFMPSPSRLSPETARSICRLWSSRPPVLTCWEDVDAEVLYEDMLPEELADIVRHSELEKTALGTAPARPAYLRKGNRRADSLAMKAHMAGTMGKEKRGNEKSSKKIL